MTDSSYNWVQSDALNNAWYSICISSSGQYVAACVNYDGIWTSSNYGLTWIQTSAPVTNWMSICCSSSGEFLAASDGSGNLYIVRILVQPGT
jgi:hypothetical protein